MRRIISRSLELLLFFVIICCVIYPSALWLVGQTLFPDRANGSMVKGPDGALVGSLLIAQPFTKDEYFQPRPSACSYDGSASSSSALAASNYALRGRVAAALGPIAKYQGGPKDGQLAAPDIEAWFQKDQYQGASGIVAQWADAHNGLAQAWVGTTFDPKNPTPQQQYVLLWEKSHSDIVAKFKKDNPTIAEPQPSDLAVVFFEAFSKENPGRFLSPVTANGPDGKPVTSIKPVKEGTDIQSNFFDMWRHENPDIALQDVPGDLVTTSGSGLDPHITLQNAWYQLDRVASKWAADLKRDPVEVRREISALLNEHASAPFGGIMGEPFVNVLEINLLLRNKYGAPAS
jgi:K+-transporting ATPase ATPase C chain